MQDVVDLKKAKKAVRRRIRIVKLKRLWRGASGHPPAKELLDVLCKRLAQRQAEKQHPCR